MFLRAAPSSGTAAPRPTAPLVGMPVTRPATRPPAPKPHPSPPPHPLLQQRPNPFVAPLPPPTTSLSLDATSSIDATPEDAAPCPLVADLEAVKKQHAELVRDSHRIADLLTQVEQTMARVDARLSSVEAAVSELRRATNGLVPVEAPVDVAAPPMVVPEAPKVDAAVCSSKFVATPLGQDVIANGSPEFLLAQAVPVEGAPRVELVATCSEWVRLGLDSAVQLKWLNRRGNNIVLRGARPTIDVTAEQVRSAVAGDAIGDDVATALVKRGYIIRAK